MNRRLEESSFEDLQVEAQYELNPAQERSACIDQIMMHLERNGPLREFREENVHSQRDNMPPLGFVDSEPGVKCAAHACSPESSGYRSGPVESAFPQLCAMMAEQLRQQQRMMQQMMTAMNINRKSAQVQYLLLRVLHDCTCAFFRGIGSMHRSHPPQRLIWLVC